MNNFETGERLLQEAREFMGEVERAFERASWNIVVRRAQEVVELALKGALKMMGIEHPKEHDVGSLFAEACAARKIEVDRAVLNAVREISARLARDRQPSFYMERVYQGEEAAHAREGAARVLALVEDLAEKLQRPRA